MKTLKSIIIFVVIVISTASSRAEEIIHYQNVPVTIQLHNGQERSIQFGDHVKIGMTKGQKIKRLFRVQSAQGAVHFLPYKTFDKQRIQVQRLTDGKVILLDLVSYDADTPLENMRIVLESENVVSDEDKELSSPESSSPVITPVHLTRYASQRLYGPSRLHNDVRGITQKSVGVSGAVKIFSGQNKFRTLSTPLVAYQGGGHYLSAIHIKNVTREEVSLNYLNLNIPFSHATFQHHKLHPNGTPGDSTVLYLISEKKLKETLYPWTYYQDLKAEVTEKIRQEKLAEEQKKRNRQPRK